MSEKMESVKFLEFSRPLPGRRKVLPMETHSSSMEMGLFENYFPWPLFSGPLPGERQEFHQTFSKIWY